MNEKELKYMLDLLDDLDDNICEEILHLNYQIDKSGTILEVSDVTFKCLEENFKTNPVTTAGILTYIQKNCTDRNIINKIQTIYIDVLKQEASEATKVEKLITLISLIQLDDDYVTEFINVLTVLSEDRFRQHRKQILMSLVPHDRPSLLKVTSELMFNNDSKEFKLSPEYMLELCYQERTHWLLKAAQVYKEQLHDLKNVTFKINNFTKQILIMVLIDITNSPETYDLPSLMNQLTNIYSILDTFTTKDNQLLFYITEIKRELTVIKFCLENNCKITTTSIFTQILNSSALAVISQVCNLSKIDRYKVSQLLNTNSDIIAELSTLRSNAINIVDSKEICMLNWNIITYNSYCAITKTIDIILSALEKQDENQDVSSLLSEIKRLVLSIKPVQCTLEVIENIYSCLFLRYEYFSGYEKNKESSCDAHSECSYFYSKKQSRNPIRSQTFSGFMSSSMITQVLLNILKICLEELKQNLSDEEKESSVLSKLQRLLEIVNHSLWKLQLVSTLSPDTRPLQLKLCLDYVEVDESSDEAEHETDLKVLKKKHRLKNRHNKTEGERMYMSTISATEDAYVIKDNGIDFISLMLAKPNCLVALALYQNDFAKANQIIEMFDLTEAEIATEVAFTEQFRNLISKIKNTIYYREEIKHPPEELSEMSVVSMEIMNLVEKFLASYRAPNSIDIMDLAARHPHLQLYSNQNIPFVIAVDILLSSGLNRDITYGLVSIVERKLSEVRGNTDVAAVKKTNYIRFIEDITSVIFEIFGNTEKSFKFTDNVCELLIDCRVPIKHKEFRILNQLSRDLRQSCEEMLKVTNFNKEEESNQNLLQKYHQIYMNVVAASDKDICNISEVSRYSNKKRIHYLRMCYMYCKTVFQLEQGDDTNVNSTVDASYFSILDRELHDILGKLLNKKQITVSYLEPICKKLNVDLISKLILTFCPSIVLSSPNKEASESNFNNLLHAVYEFKNTEEELFVEAVADFAPIPRAPDPQSLTYIVLHNWVLAHIIKKIHVSPKENNLQQSMDDRTKYLNNYMELDRFNSAKILFGGNKYLASLHSTVNLDQLFLYLPHLIKSGKLLKTLNIIETLSERQLKNSANLINLRDLILFKLAINPSITNNWKYCQYLKCSDLKMDLIMNNLCHWPADGAIEVLDYLKFFKDSSVLDGKLYEKCSDWIIKVPLYDQIASIMGVSHWFKVYEMSITNKEQIIEILMDSQQFKLCLEWADVHDVSDNMKNLIVLNLLRQYFEYLNQENPDVICQLLQRLPTAQAIEIILEEMSKIRNVEILEVCVDFMTDNAADSRSFENIKIGLQIIMEIDMNLRCLFWDLIQKPLLMIEQFLMNAKLDILSNILSKISSNLNRDPNGDNLYYNIKLIDTLIISRNAVDALLRVYAEKALDMKNPQSVCTTPPRPSDDSLLQSIDSINIEAASRPFVMPVQVPTKEQWMDDNSADRCTLCRSSIFSMIIRRHHCRRCGRLVCHVCSRHRMEVPTYSSGVKLRVCNDCYTQTMNRKPSSVHGNYTLMSNSVSTGSDYTYMDWCLSNSETRNEAVREEFGYEFTPNVTLCLSIMKMHSINLDYPRFLLDRSDEVARELSSGGDARLLVRARRSLLLAAAELYSRTPHEKGAQGHIAETGAAHAARCLAHSDALTTLVRHHAQHLLPHHAPQPSQIVRSLLEAEKWELALEIATKSGLSRSSVLAAWGKSCLKAGCFKQAREKFALCFKSTNNYVEMPEECEYGREVSESHFVNRRLHSLRTSERTSSISSQKSEGRLRNNPPLLNEIIGILEEMSYPVNQLLLNKAENIKATNEKLSTTNTTKKKLPLNEPALNIMHMLASVNKIKQGDYSDFQIATVQPRRSFSQNLLRRNVTNEQKVDYQKRLDPFFYKECVYYLTSYGSHVANIAFYMKHSTLTQVITYCYENLVDKEIFTESVYMECLKKDKVDEMLKAMTDLDSTLDMWAEYIMHICRTLEMSKRVEALYKLQCGSNQHARASATCAVLYSRPVPAGNLTFATLLARQHHLISALHHLELCVPAPTRINDSLQFQLDKPTLDGLITTMRRQIELTKYLAVCEAEKTLNKKVLEEVLPMQISGHQTETKDVRPLTLFGSNTDKIRLVAAVLATGQTVSEGFNLAFSIIREHKLDSMNIYTHVAKYLVQVDRFMEVKVLAQCIRKSRETAASLMSDQVLEAGVGEIVSRCEARGQLHDEQAELLIENVNSITIKITCYLICHNVHNAYLLAAKHNRVNDLRRVMHEAERLNNEQVRNACLKRINALMRNNHSVTTTTPNKPSPPIS